MKFFDLVKQRYSVRRYANKAVSKEDILKCVEAARLAPSAQNSQPTEFIILQDPNKIKEFSKKVFSGVYLPSSFAKKASAIAVLMAKPDFLTNVVGKQLQDISYFLLDVGIAGEHFVLQAQELGIGTCWIGWFNTKAVKNFFDLPKQYKILSLIAMGYPVESKVKSHKRKSIDDIIYKWI